MGRLPTGFQRVLTIEEVHARLKRVRCTVRWGGGTAHHYLAEGLMEWRP